MINIACIDDDLKLIEVMERFVENHSEFKCILKAHSIGEFLEALNDDLSIDIVLLDISLGATDSLGHLGKIKKLLPDAKVIIMTGHEEKAYLIKALEEGANSYYLKSSSPAQLIDTILATHQGGTFLDPKAATGLVELFQHKKNNAEINAFPGKDLQKQWDLTNRELQVAEGIFLEKTYKEIAQDHTISIDTVRHYLKSLYKKMGVHNKLQLIRKIRNLSMHKNW